jgi:hypothetical protein
VRGACQVLVQLRDEPPESATWEYFDEFHASYPDFQLEDELDFDGGRNVMYGRTYFRRDAPVMCVGQPSGPSARARDVTRLPSAPKKESRSQLLFLLFLELRRLSSSRLGLWPYKIVIKFKPFGDQARSLSLIFSSSSNQSQATGGGAKPHGEDWSAATSSVVAVRRR